MKKSFLKERKRVSSHKIPKVLLIGLLFSLCLSTNLLAQGITVKGKVIEASTSEPLVGVSVQVKGLPQVGRITDVYGNYSIDIPSSNATLTFSYLGFQTTEMPINGRTTIDVTLTEDTKLLEEVVVIGYGTMLKKDLTGSVVQIRPDALASENPKTVQDILRGTAGLAVGYDASAKGGGGIQIRGQRSVYTSGSHNEPLIILDGMMFYGEMSEINPDDISQVDILKDASAAAIYGAQAANGVLIISTKKGKIGRPVVNISINTGTTTKSAYREMWNTDEYLQHRVDWRKRDSYALNPTTGAYEAYLAKGSPPRAYYEHPDNLASWGVDLNTWRNSGSILPAAGESDLSLWARRIGLNGEGAQLLMDNFLAGKTFDWWAHTFRTGINQDYNASVSGASDRINYYMSFGYQTNEGAIDGNFFNNVRSNMKVDGKVTDWLEIGANVNFQKRSDGDIQPNLTTSASEANSNPLRNSPFGIFREEDGSLAQFPHGVTNRLGKNFDFDRQFQERDAGHIVLNTQFNAKVKLPFGITYSFNASPRYQFAHTYTWSSSEHPAWAAGGGSVTRNNSWRFDWSLNNQLLWEKTFNKVHRFSITLVQEAERRQSWSDNISAGNFQPSDALGFHNTSNATKENSSFSTSDSQHSATDMLGRLFYSYDDRYMLTASLRRDGYSAFGQSNPYATFPSLAFAWTFTNESFFNFEPMNHGKLRVTWGRNGNRSLGDPYISLANLSTGGNTKYAYINSTGTPVNFHFLQIDRMANPNLKWEKSEGYNVGLDFSFLRNRISSTIEGYYIATRDMIMSQSLTQFSGFSSMTTNLGEVSNRGIEFSLNTVNVRSNVFEWSSTLNFAYNKNRIEHLYYEYEDVLDTDGNVIGKKEVSDTSNGWHIGQPISVIWTHKNTGIWQVNEIEEAAKYNQRPGDPKFQKNPDNPYQTNASGYIAFDNNDRYFLGQTTAPINWSFRNDFTFFKDLTLSMNMYSRMGHKSTSGNFMNDDNASNILIQGANEFKKEYWTPENPSTGYARIQAAGPPGASSNKLFDRAFIRLETISLSYSVPKKFTSKFDVEKLKIYGSVRNVAVWCKDWPYADPETGGLATRVFSLGLNVTF